MTTRCPDESLLALHVGGDLDEQAGSEVRRHLPDCQRCRALMDDFRGNQIWLASRREAPLDGRLLAEFQERLSRQLGERAPAAAPVAWLARVWEFLRPVRQPVALLATSAWLVVVIAGSFVQPREAPVTGGTAGGAVKIATGEASSPREVPLPLAELHDADEVLPEPDEAARLRIELTTRDPDVRIIWFASNTASGGL